MLNLRTVIGFGLLIAIVAVVSVACGDDGKSEEEAVADLCESLTELEATAANLNALGPESTVDDLEQAAGEVSDALDNVAKAAEDVSQASGAPVQSAFEDLDQAINDIPDDATLAEAAASIEPELVAVGNAFDQVAASVTCP